MTAKQLTVFAATLTIVVSIATLAGSPCLLCKLKELFEQK
jgi:hypothetical protein